MKIVEYYISPNGVAGMLGGQEYLSHQVSAQLVCWDISTASQENPEGPNVWRRYLLLRADSQIAERRGQFCIPSASNIAFPCKKLLSLP